ncbi:MAG: ATP-grasp domain-containing protein [Clostridia bacterium]|nr:ATP-grasp domain-containing protein [Clostridia bacterium]
MQKLGIIGASYLQLPLIEKAKEMGFETHVFAWAAGDVGEEAADHFYPISITEVEAIAEKCREIGVCGVCSIATDLGNYTVNYVAHQLGLPGNSMEATRRSTNKHLMRQAFAQGGDPSPRSLLVEEGTDFAALELTYPVIVKPTDRSGSRGIYKLNSPEGLAEKAREAMAAGFEKKALIEEYAEGQEYSLEGISFRGEHHILAMTLKHTTGAPSFIETGHRQPAPVSPEMFEQAAGVVIHALDTLGITDSASHSEIKIDAAGNIKIIEIGSRMGGDAIGSHLVPCSTGIDYVGAVIQVACGQQPDLAPRGKGFPAEVRYILTEADLREFQRIQREDPARILEILDAPHPDRMGKTTNSADRAGCYLARVKD